MSLLSISASAELYITVEVSNKRSLFSFKLYVYVCVSVCVCGGGGVIMNVITIILSTYKLVPTTSVIKIITMAFFILICSRHITHLLGHVTDASQWSLGWEPVDKMVFVRLPSTSTAVLCWQRGL